MRNVRRQRVVSASLFDQRRMRLQASNNSSMNGSSTSSSNGVGMMSKRFNRKDSTRMDSMETIELIPPKIGMAKIPKSPAPTNFQAV